MSHVSIDTKLHPTGYDGLTVGDVVDTSETLLLGAYEFDTTQTPNAGTDDYVLTYDDVSGKIRLEAAPGAGGGDAWGDAVDADILPTGSDATYDVGSLTARIANMSISGAISFGDLADHPFTPATGVHQIWVRASDNKLIFTDEAGTDTDLTSGGGGGDAWSDPVDAVITPDADGTRNLAADATRFATGYFDALDITNNIIAGGTVDGRDLQVDGSKLDAIEANADVTDATNVAAAGAIMDGDFTSNGLMKRTGAGTYDTAADGTDYLSSVLVDTTPQLGGNLDVNGNKIVSVSNGNIDIEPNGTGNVLIGNFTFDADQTVGAGQDNYVLTYDDGTGLISLEAAAAGGGGDAWSDPVDAVITPDADGTRDLATTGTRFATGYLDALDITNNITVGGTVDGRDIATDGALLDTAMQDVVDDTTPQLGGNLDVNGNSIVSTSNGAITLAPNGTGNVVLGNFEIDADQTLGAGQDNYVLTYDNTSGTWSAEVAPGAGGGISNVVEDTTPQLGGMLDVNGQSIGDGTLELLTFTEDASAVNHVNIENEATGSGPIISAAGDDTNIDLNLTGKGTGDVIIHDVQYSGAVTETVYTITDGAAFEVDPRNGTIQVITLTASRTPKATNFENGQSITLMVDDGTAYTITWTDATWGTGGVTWVGGSAPTLATTGYSVITFWKVAGETYGSHTGDVA